MRREDYERTYGRRGLPPPVSASSQDSRRSSKKSKRKMKCLISIGLILPALAAVIGVAAWAVSADVVMNSNGNRVNNADNQLLQGIERNNRRNVFQDNQNPPSSEDEPDVRRTERRTSTRATTRRTTTSTTTTTTTAAPPGHPDPGSIISKLISASNAASGGNGPRFVVVAPLPDHGKMVPTEDLDPQLTPRADPPSSKFSDNWKPTKKQMPSESDSHDLLASSSNTHHHKVLPPPSFHPANNNKNITNRIGLANAKHINQRRSGEPSFYLDLSNNNNPRRGMNSQPIDMSGFEPFMSPESLLGSPSVHVPPPQVPGFMGPFTATSPNRGMQQNKFFNAQREQHMANHPHVFNDSPFSNKPVFEHNPPPPPPPSFNHAPNSMYGLKPIQQHLHHQENNGGKGPPQRADESKRWGAVSFHSPPGGGYIPEPPKGISLSISSPGQTHAHSAEPVSVIKSFFLPFLPKPKLNMNARVVFGVVLDKGVGFGGAKKDAGHLHQPVY